MLPLSRIKSTASRHLLGIKTQLWKPSVSSAAQSSCWYAGMVVDPTGFSQQLGNLQSSLHRANTPDPLETTEAVLVPVINAAR